MVLKLFSQEIIVSDIEMASLKKSIDYFQYIKSDAASRLSAYIIEKYALYEKIIDAKQFRSIHRWTMLVENDYKKVIEEIALKERARLK